MVLKPYAFTLDEVSLISSTFDHVHRIKGAGYAFSKTHDNGRQTSATSEFLKQTCKMLKRESKSLDFWCCLIRLNLFSRFRQEIEATALLYKLNLDSGMTGFRGSLGLLGSKALLPGGRRGKH